MGKQRYLDTKFWSDSYVEKLDPVEKLLFIYLMTNERTNLAGVYELPIKYMSVETGIERSMLENVLSRFERDGKVVMHEGWVRMVNAIKHQNSNNAKIVSGIQKILDDVPEDIRQGLKLNLDDSSMTHVYPMDDSSHIIESNTIESNIIKSNSEKEIDGEAMRLAQKLHHLVHQRYNFTETRPHEVKKSYDSIEKLHRLDGRDYPLIEQVLDWSQQDEFWMQNIRSGEKLRKQFTTMLIRIKSQYDQQSGRVVIAGQG